MTEMTDTEYDKRLQKIAKDRYARQMACAYYQRADVAGIPKQYQGINSSEFKKFLSEDYHSDIDKITDFVYKDVVNLVKTPYILVDGGDAKSRRRASFAILFRLITCNNFALYKRCNEIEQNLSAFTSIADRSRKDWSDHYKKYDAFFIDEFKYDLFKAHQTSGDFFDDILEYRADNFKPTIIAFRTPLSEANILYETHCGDCIRRLSQKEYPDSYIKGQHQKGDKLTRIFNGKDKENPYNGILRVRVKICEEIV